MFISLNCLQFTRTSAEQHVCRDLTEATLTGASLSMVASAVIFFLLIMVRFLMRQVELIVRTGLLCAGATWPHHNLAVVHTNPYWTQLHITTHVEA